MKEFLESIEHESDAFAATIRAESLNRRVPGCPDWALRDLVWHLGRVHRFWAKVVRAGADEQPDFGEAQPAPEDAARTRRVDARLHSRAPRRAARRAGGRARVDVVARAAYRGCHRPTSGARSGRAQVGRAVRARYTGSLAGCARPTDGVDEFLEISRQMRPPSPIAFEATDTGRRFMLSEGEPAVTVSASSGDLVLLLYRRLSPDDVRVDGDRAVLDEYLAPIE